MEKRGSDDDDRQELIDAEFESMVANLNLNQDTGSTYLDELVAREREIPQYRQVPQIPRHPRNIFQSIVHSVKRWFNNTDNDGDGAVV